MKSIFKNFGLFFFFLMLSFLTIPAKSVDPNKTEGAVYNGLIAYAILSETFVYEILGHLPYAVQPL